MQTSQTYFEVNLLAAWAGILLGFASGLVFGLSFHREQWLGGYSSFKRRLYRLGHISFFGLAVVNFMFYFTARTFLHPGPFALVASSAFVMGAVTMPACCFATAHIPAARALFSIPVLSLLLAGALTLVVIWKEMKHEPGRYSLMPQPVATSASDPASRLTSTP